MDYDRTKSDIQIINDLLIENWFKSSHIEELEEQLKTAKSRRVYIDCKSWEPQRKITSACVRP